MRDYSLADSIHIDMKNYEGPANHPYYMINMKINNKMKKIEVGNKTGAKINPTILTHSYIK